MGGTIFLLEIAAIAIGILFNPITWMIVAIVLIVRDQNKKKSQGITATDSNGNPIENKVQKTNTPPPPPKPANPMAKWNWLLYIGSFLIVMAMYYFVSSVNDSFVAPFTIILTLIIFSVGIAIHRSIDYLQPVGKAFIYSALFMIPFWIISLESIGIDVSIVPFIVALSFAFAALMATIIVSDKVMAYFAFLSIIPLVWSFYPLLNITNDHGVYYYFAFLAPMITALLATVFYVNNNKSLPEAFKPAATLLGKVLMPVSYYLSLSLFFMPDIYTAAPFLRFVCSLFFLIYTLALWLHKKSHKSLILLRFAVQTVVLSLTLDTLGASLTSYQDKATDVGVALCCVMVWLLTFTAQILCALFAKKQNEEDKKLEYIVSVVSIVCIFLAPSFCQGLATSALAMVWLTICLVVAVLGIVHALHYKNVTWSIATAISIMLVPIIFGSYVAVPSWKGGAYLIAYAIIAAAFLAGTYILRKTQEKEAHLIGAISVSCACLAVCIAAYAENVSYAGYFLTTCAFLAFAYISKIKAFYEVSVYSFALCLMSISRTLIANTRSTGVSNYGYTNYVRDTLDAHITFIALIGTQYLASRLYKTKGEVRLIVGYSLFTYIMGMNCLLSFNEKYNLVWALIFLVEQVGALLYGVFKKRNWMIWSSSIVIFLVAFKLTGGMSYLWLGIIGIALIMIVVWQLRKANGKMKKEPPKEQ